MHHYTGDLLFSLDEWLVAYGNFQNGSKMPSVEENREKWGSAYCWPQDGDEWSSPWGGPDMQWNWVIAPRLAQFFPARKVLEIAPGRGRWTRFLVGHAEHFLAVDLSNKCIESCRERFKERRNAEFHVNDGRSLDCAGDGEIDLVFSFDSLVHVDSDVIDAYVREIARVLSPEGAAFLHHSNLGAYPFRVQLSRVPKVRGVIRNLGLLDKSFHWRAPGMSGDLMISICARHGLVCVGQELVNWGSARVMIDAFSTIVRPGSRWEKKLFIMTNKRFMRDAARTKEFSRLYGAGGS